jgi:hypothetical protein
VPRAGRCIPALGTGHCPALGSERCAPGATANPVNIGIQGLTLGFPRFPRGGLFRATTATLSFMIDIFVCSPHPQIGTNQVAKWSGRIQSQQQWRV